MKCPEGYKKINGLCVPYKVGRNRSMEYGSLFSNDMGNDQVFIPPPNPYEPPDNYIPNIPDDNISPDMGDLVNNNFTDGDRSGVYSITPAGVVILEYDDGEVTRYPPDMYLELLTSDTIEFEERIMNSLSPFIDEELASQISDAQAEIARQNEIDETGQDSQAWNGTPSGNVFYYKDENGRQQEGTYYIQQGAGATAGRVALQFNEGGTPMYFYPPYDTLLVEDYYFSQQLLRELNPFMTEYYNRQPTSNNDNNDTTPVGARRIDNFDYHAEREGYQGYGRFTGYAYVYDDRIQIYDNDGTLIADEPIYYDQEGHPNRFSVSYNGQTLVYNDKGTVKVIIDDGTEEQTQQTEREVTTPRTPPPPPQPRPIREPVS